MVQIRCHPRVRAGNRQLCLRSVSTPRHKPATHSSVGVISNLSMSRFDRVGEVALLSEIQIADTEGGGKRFKKRRFKIKEGKNTRWGVTTYRYCFPAPKSQILSKPCVEPPAPRPQSTLADFKSRWTNGVSLRWMTSSRLRISVQMSCLPIP